MEVDVARVSLVTGDTIIWTILVKMEHVIFMILGQVMKSDLYQNYITSETQSTWSCSRPEKTLSYQSVSTLRLNVKISQQESQNKIDKICVDHLGK